MVYSLKMNRGKISVGIYITSDFIYSVWIRNTIRGPEVFNFKKINIKEQTPDEINQISAENSIIDKDEIVISTLKRLFAESKITASRIFTAIPSKEVTVRYFQMPILPKKEWHEAVRFEAKKYIPFNLDEVIIDYQVLGSTPKKNKMSVLFVASKKEVIKKHLSIFNKAGIKLEKIEIAPLSLIRVFQFNRDIIRKGSQVLLEVDKDIVTLTIHKEGVPYLIRDFSISSRKKEEETKQEKLASLNYENLLRELQLSLEYYYEQFPNESITELIFMSQDDKDKEWMKLLSEDLIMPVKSPTLIEKVNIPSKDFSLNILVALGLALNQTVKIPVSINLYPVGVTKIPSVIVYKREVPRFLIVETVTFCISLIILYTVMQSQVLNVNKQIQSIILKREALGLEFGPLSKKELIIIQDNLGEKRKLLRNKIDDRFYWTHKFSRLPALLPDKAWINSIMIFAEDDRIRRRLLIRGMIYTEDKAEEIELVNRFISNLKQDPVFFEGFSEVELISLEKMRIGDFDIVEFSISCY